MQSEKRIEIIKELREQLWELERYRDNNSRKLSEAENRVKIVEKDKKNLDKFYNTYRSLSTYN